MWLANGGGTQSLVTLQYRSVEFSSVSDFPVDAMHLRGLCGPPGLSGAVPYRLTHSSILSFWNPRGLRSTPCQLRANSS